jgi:hypothetical protein
MFELFLIDLFKVFTFEKWQDFVLEEDKEIIADGLRYGIRTGEPYFAEFRMKEPDHTIRWIKGKG